MLSEIDRQLAHVWRRRLLGREKGAPKIAVVGNCQSFGVAYGMKLLLPAAQVDRFTIVNKGLADLGFLARTLANYDHVFSLEFQPGFVRGGGWEELRARMPSVQPIPSIVFSCFHPDTVYVLDPARGGRPIESPTGPYHSAIALYAYLRGMNAEQTEGLFNADFFAALGYFDIWEESAQQFLALAAEARLDLSGELVRWSRRGAFMYSMNHPKAHVLFDVARALLKRAGLPHSAQIEFDDFAVDDIVRGAVYPVYPEIAERYGHRGNYLFKRANYELSRSVGEFLGLRAYIESCFSMYAKESRASLSAGAHRVQSWLNDEQVGRLFDWHAADAVSRRHGRR